MATPYYSQRSGGDTLAASGWHDGPSSDAADRAGSGSSFSVFLKSKRLKASSDAVGKLGLAEVPTAILQRVVAGTNRIDTLVDEVALGRLEVTDSLRQLEGLGYVLVTGDDRVEPTQALAKLTEAM